MAGQKASYKNVSFWAGAQICFWQIFFPGHPHPYPLPLARERENRRLPFGKSRRWTGRRRIRTTRIERHLFLLPGGDKVWMRASLSQKQICAPSLIGVTSAITFVIALGINLTERRREKIFLLVGFTCTDLYWLVLRWLSSVRISAGNRAIFPLRVMGFLCLDGWIGCFSSHPDIEAWTKGASTWSRAVWFRPHARAAHSKRTGAWALSQWTIYHTTMGMQLIKCLRWQSGRRKNGSSNRTRPNPIPKAAWLRPRCPDWFCFCFCLHSWRRALRSVGL